MIDRSGWKHYRIGDLFTLEVGKVNNKGNLLEAGNNCLYLGASKQQNCVISRCSLSEELLQKGNCILFICDGQGSVGYTNYIDKEFIATVNITAGYNEHLNPYVGLFLVTILDLERPKYSYGRKWKTHLADTRILLPTNHATGEPDWQFMEEYMKALPVLSVCTNTIGIDSNLHLRKIDRGKCHRITEEASGVKCAKFIIGDLFNVHLTKGDLKASDCTTNPRCDSIPLVSAGDSNNGYIGSVEKSGDGMAEVFSGNSITVDMFCKAYYQPRTFYAVGHGRVNILIPKFKLNVYRALYICSIINNEKYRFSYGRALYSNTIKDLHISLPVTSKGEPDWQYMENYIKSLPMGDKLDNFG